MFQHVSTCFNMFQHVSTCFNMFHVKLDPWLTRLVGRSPQAGVELAFEEMVKVGWELTSYL